MTMKEKLMGIFSKSLDEAMVEETPPAAQDQQPDMAQVLAAIMGRLDAIEAALKPAGDGETPPAAEGETPPAGEGEGTPAAEGDHTPEEMSALEQRLSTIEQALAKLAGLDSVPVLDSGVPLKVFLDGRTLQEVSTAQSTLNPKLLREGIVIRPMAEMTWEKLGQFSRYWFHLRY